MFAFLNNLGLDKMRYKRYFIVFGAFVVWMTFFDKSRWPVQLKLSNVQNNLESEMVEYEERIVEAEEDKVDLENNLEKYAREKFYMHKPGEKVFIIDKVKSK